MGNRTSATLLGTGTVSYSANNLNQYTSVASVAPTYDVNGNTLTLANRSFSYDGQSRMTSTTVGIFGLPGYHAASFVYDARNRQVSRTVDGQTTYFVWDDWNLLAEYQVSGGTPTQIARYMHGPRLDEILMQARGIAPTPVYLHEDALGSTYLTTDASGSVVERYTYTAFGEVSAFDNTGVAVAAPITRFLYTGREWITGIGLNDHRNRFYFPSLGRWPSRDPIQEKGGLNLYGYVENKITNTTDPLGLQGAAYNQRTGGSRGGNAAMCLDDAEDLGADIAGWGGLLAGVGSMSSGPAAPAMVTTGTVVGLGGGGLWAGAKLGKFLNKMNGVESTCQCKKK